MTSGDDTGAKAREAAKKAKPNWWLRAVRSGAGQAIRWLLVLSLVVGHWLVTVLGPVTGHGHWLTTASLVFGQKGATSGFAGWVPVIVISVVLLLPDADSVAFGGVKFEMRQTREAVEQLRQEIQQTQGQEQATHVHIYYAGAGPAADKVDQQLTQGEHQPDADPSVLRTLWDQD
jgi:hypothetical protein